MLLRWNHAYSRRRERAKPQLTERRFAGQPDDLYGDDYRGSRNRGWLLLPIVYAFALINLAFATFVPNEYITHLETTPGMLVHIGLSLFSYATLIIAALYALQLAWIDYQLKNKSWPSAAKCRR
jgi:hypothetical protein